MSAIAGIWDHTGQRPGDTLSRLASSMAGAAMAGAQPAVMRNGWHDGAANIALAYLGPPPDRPFISSCGRFVLVCEGEIYNGGALIGELRAAGRAVADDTDMAAMVEGAAQWGIAAILRRANGAFAGALWDREQRALHLFRD